MRATPTSSSRWDGGSASKRSGFGREFPDQRQELARAVGLGEIRGGSCLVRLQFITALREGRHHDDRNMGRRRIMNGMLKIGE